MQVGDKVRVKGVPGTVLRVEPFGVVRMFLVLFETPSLRWVPGAALASPPRSGRPAMGAPPNLCPGDDCLFEGSPSHVVDVTDDMFAPLYLVVVSTYTVQWSTGEAFEVPPPEVPPNPAGSSGKKEGPAF